MLFTHQGNLPVLSFLILSVSVMRDKFNHVSLINSSEYQAAAWCLFDLTITNI
ncbi:Uncharacterised protein [Yersinia thracica]|uniref:Uncharacterized protein n=1 Tax=Yersinia thracica TaxID=2890319 RepID=A0A0T9NBP2_9GAMM|nr:Uncharacterised protein [Yersinia thracica]